MSSSLGRKCENETTASPLPFASAAASAHVSPPLLPRSLSKSKWSATDGVSGSKGDGQMHSLKSAMRVWTGGMPGTGGSVSHSLAYQLSVGKIQTGAADGED